MLTYRASGWGPAWVPRLLGVFLLMLSYLSVAEAQDRRYLFELGLGGALQSFGDSTALKSAPAGVGRIGLWLPLNFSVEAEGSTSSPKAKTVDTGVGVKTLSASVLYNLPLGSKNWAYGKLGVGTTRYGKDPCLGPTICGTAKPIIAGLGFRIAVAPVLMVRGEAAANFNKTTADTGVAPNRGSRTVKFSNYGFNLGMSIMLGSKPFADSDGDGVPDNRDRCSDTPRGARVDANGCPIDSDGDGVPDGIDRCPNTPLGATVDSNGCPRDSDGDNIPDGLDKCPNTPPGVVVDANGCPKDSDGDGIPDGIDRCPDTPKGATVDALGCPGDEDSDGVLDGLDWCPRTPIGATVDAHGCAAGQVPTRPSGAQSDSSPAPPRSPPARSLDQPRGGPRVLEGVTFESGSARLQSGSYGVLDSIAKVLLASPTMKVEIGGHTDDAGTPADNLRLSTLRAEAVRTYLVVKGVPFQQMVARGYGATVPRTPDTTPSGRAANRRVEIKPLSPGP